MATLSSLQRQLNELKQNEARLRREMDEQVQRINTEYKIRLSSLERGITQAINQNNAQQALRLQQQIEQLRQEQERSTRAAYDQLDRELREQIEGRQRELMEQLQAFCTQAEQRINALGQSLTQQDAEKAALAGTEYQNALQKYQQVDQRAHAQLFPGRMQVFMNSLRQAQTMMEQQQFEASAATSVMLTVRLTDFEYEIDDKLTQWIGSFSKLRESTGKMQRKLEEALTVEDRHISPELAMEWLEHRYDDIFELLDRCGAVIGRVERHREQLGQAQVTNPVAERYIRTGEAESSRELSELVRTLNYELPRKITRIGEELASIWRCAGQRKAWAEAIEAYMRRKRNTGDPVRNDFRETAREEHMDGRMEFRQPMPNGQFREVVCRIVPVLHGKETENHIRFYFKGKFPNPRFQSMYMEQYIPDVMEALQVRALNIGLGGTPEVLEGGADQHYSLQKDPRTGAELLVRHGTQPGQASGGGAPAGQAASGGTNGRQTGSRTPAAKKKQTNLINR